MFLRCVSKTHIGWSFELLTPHLLLWFSELPLTVCYVGENKKLSYRLETGRQQCIYL